MLYLLDKHFAYTYNVHMKRMNFYLTEQQITALQILSKETGLCMSELIRRAIDYWLEQEKGRDSVKDKKGRQHEN